MKAPHDTSNPPALPDDERAASYVSRRMEYGGRYTAVCKCDDGKVRRFEMINERWVEMYLVIYDDSRATTEAKIVAAVEAYVARFQAAPNIVLMHDGAGVAVAGVTIRSAGYVQRNTFYVGWEAALG